MCEMSSTLTFRGQLKATSTVWAGAYRWHQVLNSAVVVLCTMIYYICPNANSRFHFLHLLFDEHSTARGHRAGVALSFVTPEDRPQLRLVKELLADEMDAAATAALKAEQEHSGAPAADPDEPLCSILKPYTLKVGVGAS